MVLLFLLLAVGMPIAVGMIATGLLYVVLEMGMDPLIAAQRVATGIDSFPLLAIPFFMLAAELMNFAGITDRIFRLAKSMVGAISGGLAYVNVLASMLFAGMSGSAVADAGGLGRIEIKAMKDDGYEVDFAAALTAASSTIGPIIPPSISFVIYGLTAGVSIGGLFAAGLLPGLMMGGALMALIAFYSKKRKYGRTQRFSWRELKDALAHAFLALMTPVIIVGGILGGIFTPTEAGAFAVLYAFILGKFIYRTLHWRDIPELIFSTALSAANVLFIIAASALIGWILTAEQVPIKLAELIVEYSASPWVLLLLINLLLFALGCFMAAAPVIIMLTPILLPVTSLMGIDPMHLGVVMVLNLMIGLITPPVGLCLFVVADVAELPVMRVVKSLIPFFIPLVIVLLLITYIPSLVLFLPGLLGYA
ncbi:MAG: TRAP transporter large permease [Candidatus Competibacteraceae bacterium]|nr:TRAP transporter large permease [Candidatus Competibacteraceae bacterium]